LLKVIESEFEASPIAGRLEKIDKLDEAEAHSVHAKEIDEERHEHKY
jgi:hypothetical protein